MAERRMFAKTIIDSDAFIDMPVTSRLLYYDLSMRADDDGFVNSPKKIMKMIGVSEDDLRILIIRKFIIPFDSGVVVIKHWKIHNYIRKDTYNETPYLEEKSLLELDENKAYKFVENEARQRVVDESSTQVRLGKVSIDKNNNICANEMQNATICTTPKFDKNSSFKKFWNAYPRKLNKKKAEMIFNRVCKNEETFNLIMKGLEIQKKTDQWTKNKGQFIPHPTTWLNGERWNDEVETFNKQEERRTDYESYGVKEDDIRF